MRTLLATNAAQWRAWLARNSRSETEIWLVLAHKASDISTPSYVEAVEHALCYGWIDGVRRKRDATSTVLRFTPRTRHSTWSPLNRRRAAQLIERGLMTEYGQAVIDAARMDGTWNLVPDSITVPDDLRELLDGNDPAARHFENFPPSSKRLILQWIAAAKRPETRRRRIERTVELASQNLRANHPPGRSAAVGPRRTPVESGTSADGASTLP